MRLICRPIDAWPGKLLLDHEREQGRFSANWTDTVDLLAREVDALTPRNVEPEVVLQLAVGEGDLRLDGWVRASARPVHPGVIVSFESIHGPLRYHTDRFRNTSVWRNGSGQTTAPGWQANVRAIALGLEALRKVDRYGIASDGEQYAGWRAISAGSRDGPMTVDEAAAFVAEHSNDPHLGGFEVVQMWGECGSGYYRQTARVLHPDHGGDPALFRRLGEARDLLDRTLGEADRG